MGFVEKVQELPEELQRRVVGTTPLEWGVSAGVSLLVCVLLFWAGKDKAAGLFSFGVLLYTVVLTLTAQLVKREQGHNQWAWTVVILSAVQMGVPGEKYFYPILLALASPIARTVLSNIKH
ncbi:hypothetical protein QOT17_002562 [Balamuthia mandrillaris]